jgi:hypothetical protein
VFDHLPPDLPRLRTLETFFALGLDEVRKAIAAKERQEAEAAARRTPPPSPDWALSYLRTGHTTRPDAVHVGGCGMAGKRTKPLTREQALCALTEGVEACPYCRPDSELGVLE